MQLTRDHKVSDPEEKKRLEDLGAEFVDVRRSFVVAIFAFLLPECRAHSPSNSKWPCTSHAPRTRLVTIQLTS